jgi:hypothetical protein
MEINSIEDPDFSLHHVLNYGKSKKQELILFLFNLRKVIPLM